MQRAQKDRTMSAHILRRINKIDDQTLYQVFLDIVALFPEQNATCEFFLTPGVSLTLKEIENPADFSGRYAFEQAVITVNLGVKITFSANYYRTILENNNRVPSAKFDEFDLAFGRDANNWQDKKDKITQISSIIGALDLPRPAGEPMDDDGTLRELLVGFGATHRQMLASLNDAIKANEEKRAEIEATYEEKEKERLEAHKKALEELEAKEAKLQLQSYKAERRRIIQQMTDDSTASLHKAMAPKGAIRARWAVFFAALGLSLLAAGFAYQSIFQFGVTEEIIARITPQLRSNVDANAVGDIVSNALGATNWFLIARSILSSLVAIGGLVYAASWLRNFYNAEVATAREIDRFNTDLVRASWIIETILEVKHEHDGEIPEAWIDGVTRGLFDNSGRNEAVDEGAQALRALMGFTASASFGPDGPKFDIGRRDARKLAKAAKRDEPAS